MSEEELIKTLRVFEKNRVEQLEEPARNLFYAIMKIADERDRLNNIIEEIREYTKHKIVECYDEGSTIGEFYKICDIDSKIEELLHKGEDKE